ncbi:hypothetical protein C8Q74DRAFT_1373808 [Fomes fomentarius]|nr:hypothetical protein C8Q74DRAFT_1373808 [Fomes fomentarius]
MTRKGYIAARELLNPNPITSSLPPTISPTSTFLAHFKSHLDLVLQHVPIAGVSLPMVGEGWGAGCGCRFIVAGICKGSGGVSTVEERSGSWSWRLECGWVEQGMDMGSLRDEVEERFGRRGVYSRAMKLNPIPSFFSPLHHLPNLDVDFDPSPTSSLNPTLILQDTPTAGASPRIGTGQVIIAGIRKGSGGVWTVEER